MMGSLCRLLSLRGIGRLGAQSTTEACRAGACHTLSVLVNESMDHTVRLVKARGDDVQVLCVTRVIPSKNRIGDVIGHLHQPRSSGVHKKWRVRDVLQGSPPGSRLSKLAAELLKRCLAGRLVENQQPTLLITLLAAAHQEIVKSLTEVLKRKLNRVLMGE